MNDALQDIKECIEQKKDFCFNAGAGSGKTYSLVQTVDYVLSQYADDLKRNNQRIMVITYTNAASNEILDRIGNTQLLDVSTIHTRMWDLISNFQDDLTSIHLGKIIENVANLEAKTQSSEYYNDAVLSDAIDNKEFVNLFYKNQSLKATDFKSMFAQYTDTGTIKNVSNFKDYVKNTIKLLRLENTKAKIENKTSGYTRVEYTPLDNYDKLYRMKFSHDTLLEYSQKLIYKSKALKKIILDRYPFIFVDEYQDTNPLVVSLLSQIAGIAPDRIVVGYFGDSCQNIYDDGVGNAIETYHPGLKPIYKPDNRRSCKSIVDVSNRIRHDELVQVPFMDEEGECDAYYTLDDSLIDSFINNRVEKLPLDEEIHCLVLKNDIVAKKSGFGEFYSLLSSTKYYKERYEQVSTEILSDDTKKLGQVPLMIYKWIKLYNDINAAQTAIVDYIPSSVYGRINGSKLATLREKMLSVKTGSLSEFIDGLYDLASVDGLLKDIIEYNVGKRQDTSIEGFKSEIFEALYNGIKEEDIPEANEQIDKILSLDFNVLKCWFGYITNVNGKRIQYHTFHGTKGLEYDNVIVVITNSFNRKTNYYHEYFKTYDDITAYGDKEFLSKRNLLYVAVTRAKHRLYVLYVDPCYSCVKNSFELIFGESTEFTVAE